MFRNFFAVILAAALSPAYCQEAPPAVRLPDISVIGNMYGCVSDDKSDAGRNQFAAREVELAVAGYVYPRVKADAVISAEKEEGGYETGVDEAKLTFERLAEGLSAETGKVRVNFGKQNRLHPHSLPAVDRPSALTGFFGEEGLSAQGGALNYTLPLPFFVQAEAGAWRNDPPEEEAEFGLSGEILTGRLKTSFAPSAKSELELGASAAKGRGPLGGPQRDKAVVLGGDLTFRLWPGAHSRLTFQSEYFYLSRELAAEKLYRGGFYGWLAWRFNKEWELGARFDYAESPDEIKTTERSVSGVAAYNFNEMFSGRVQWKRRSVEGKTVNECWLQLIFGMGPHTHSMS